MSHVPYWDMWDGYLDFYMRVLSGDSSAWWYQHNEHRIVFSRILFWIDFTFFNGSINSLLIANLILASGLFFSFFFIIRKFYPLKVDKHIRFIFWGLSAILTFSWIQSGNFILGFQNQFFAAYLFPLICFLLLASSKIKDSILLFFLAALVGIISAGTMANGVLALPLLVVLSLNLNLNRFRISFLLILSIVILYLYFFHYKSPLGHSTVFDTVKNQPFNVIIYIITYLGGPLYYITGECSYFLVKIAGIFMIGSTIYLAFKSYFSSHPNRPFFFALLAFLFYVEMTAFITSGGRLVFGVQQCLQSRYMTPVLLGWAVTIILYSCFIPKHYFLHPLILVLFGLIPILFLPTQLKALENPGNYLFDQKIASLALELGIKDEKKINLVFPYTDWVIRISNKAKVKNLSIFGDKQIQDASLLINRHFHIPEQRNCYGYLDDVSIISTDSNFAQVSGWIFDEIKQKIPESIIILNENNYIVGYAITGMQRPDLKAAISLNAEYSGFVGYISLKNISRSLTFVGKNPRCKFFVQSIFSPYKIESEAISSFLKIYQNLLSTNCLMETNWKESATFEKENFNGFFILGSHITGDSDTGSVVCSSSRRSSLLFKTGPEIKNQVLSLYSADNQLLYSDKLPLSREWRILSFSANWLPKEFKVIISDNGKGWGEWSAVAFKQNY